MALLDELIGSDQYDDYKAKINAAIQVINLLAGGTAGQILEKNSDDDFDVAWVDPPIVPVITSLPPIQTGVWNMTSTDSINIPHGLADIDKIKTLSLFIRNDDGSERYDFLGEYANIGSDKTGRSGFVAYIDSTNIVVTRVSATDGGIFYGSSFDSVSINRGYLTIGVSA